MKPRSAKNKGKRLQNKVRDLILEKFNQLWSAIEQAENNSGNHTPLVIFKRNRTKTYAVLEFDKLLKLLDETD